MVTVFIIGGIGSGKSAVLRVFTKLGFPVLDLDRIGHQVLTEEPTKDLLLDHFGKKILDADGEINRQRLANEAFCSKERTTMLTQATEPAITKKLEHWLADQKQAGHSLAVVEVSAFNGSNCAYAGLADTIVAVSAPLSARVSRAVSRGFSEQDVRRRIESQPSDLERQNWADYEILNDGSIDKLEKTVRNLIEHLR